MEHDNIKRRRKELKMTQTELAKRVGYTDKSMISKIEKGEVDIPTSKLRLFALALNTSVDYLVGNSLEPSYLVDQSIRYFDKYDEDLSHIRGYLYEHSYTIDTLKIDGIYGDCYIATDPNGVSYGPTEVRDILENYRNFGLGNIQLLFEDCSHDSLNSDEQEFISDYRDLNDTGKEAARNMVKGLKVTFPKEDASETAL